MASLNGGCTDIVASISCWVSERKMLKTSIFWDITPYITLVVNGRFVGTCHFHLQVQIIAKQETNMKKVSRSDFNGLHGVISHKIEFFITNAIRASDPTKKESFNSWDITPSSSLKAKRRFERTFCFHLQDRRISQGRNQREACGKQRKVGSRLTLKMEVRCSSEISVDFQRTTLRYTL
jgi:hypothetical protein